VRAAGPGYVTAADSTGAEMMKIVQTPALIVILNPDLTYRQIFLDGRTLEEAPNPTWMGYSVGRWEGDTLIVESLGFNDRTWLDHDGHPHTEALRMTERYRRRNVGNLEVEVTLSDPKTYSKPWTVAVRAELAADTEMIEWVCNESPHGVEHWVGKASDERKGEVKVAPDGRGDVPLIATSDTSFTGLYGLGVEFIDGGAGGLFVKHVSGNYRFARK
jgi:hypothetical protein